MRKILATVLLLACVGCGAAANIPRAVIDCTVSNRPQIEALILEFRQILVGESPNWQAVLDKAIAAGVSIGGCALAELAQTSKTAPQAMFYEPGTRSAQSVLEDYRSKHAGGSTFRTPKGEI